MLTVPARHPKEGVFTATGGSVWYEVDYPYDDSGLIEGATPECRGPRQLLAYQRAQDRLLGEAAQQASLEGDFSLLKNDRDARGNVYGAQENYEAELASGWQLFLWRAGLVALMPIVVLSWLALVGVIVGGLAWFAIASLVYFVIGSWDDSKRLALWMFGRDVADGRETGQPCPPWLCHVMAWMTNVIAAPLAIALTVLISVCAFRRARRQLLPFLISRSIFAGAGMIDAHGKFHLADKAGAMNCVAALGGFVGERPIFCFGHFFKKVFYDACFSPRDYFALWEPQQRLQIALGDSNMADVAEYLRVGATMLVLDCIEAGAMPELPRVRRPIRSLRRINADPSLAATVRLADGADVTALRIQRFYWEACRRFLSRREDAPAQARDVLRRWGDVLDRLEHERHTLVGEVDWLTKMFLLQHAGRDASWSSKKKIDLRYHELTDAGYFTKLKLAGHTTVLVDDETVERAMRTAPHDTPATTRAHYIREFAGGEQAVTANWSHIFLGEGKTAKVVRLSDFGRAATIKANARRLRRKKPETQVEPGE
jgi:hypothetical protein